MEALGPNPAGVRGWKPTVGQPIRALTNWSQSSRDTIREADAMGIVLHNPSVAAPPSQIDEGMQIALYGLFERVAQLEDAVYPANRYDPHGGYHATRGGTRRRRRAPQPLRDR